MRIRPTPAVALAALLLAVAVSPAATAEWKVHGSFEPDTALDATGAFMFTQPDTSGNPNVRKLYFNAIGNFYSTGMNANSEITGSRLVAFPFQNVGAYLGVWKDCDGDGYIGMGAGALTEYRSALLGRQDICASGGEFNDGEWVYEFLWIDPGFQPTSRATKPLRAIHDPDAYVWGDTGLPGRPAMGHMPTCGFQPNSAGIGDTVTAPYYGSTESTGGMLKYADCYTSHAIARGVSDLDVTGLLAFDDPENPQESDSLLDQRAPVSVFGEDRADGSHRDGVFDARSDEPPAFQVFDCDEPKGTADVRDPSGQAPRTVTVNDPTGRLHGYGPFDPDGSTDYQLTDAEGSYVTVPALAPSANDPQGSWYHALNETERAIAKPVPERANPNGHFACAPFGTGLGDDSTTWRAHQAIALAPARDPDTIARRFNDYAFGFRKGQTDVPHTLRNETTSRGVTQLSAFYPLGRDAPTSLGLDALRFTSGSFGPSWDASFRSKGLPLIDRSSLQPAGPEYETFYARVGTATLARASAPGLGTYGQEWCGTTFNDRVADQFDCLPSRWWDPTQDALSRVNGDLDSNGRPDGAYPGWTYHLRDVDCRDGSLARAAPVSPATLSNEGNCP